MSLHALVPARKNSKRLPGKHMRLLGGAPLIDWTLSAAFESGVFDQICVSTDDPAVQKRGEHFGCAPFPLRPDYLCTDSANSSVVVRHYLDSLTQSGNPLPERLALLQATSPFRGATRIREAVEKAPSLALVSLGPLWKPAAWNRMILEGRCVPDENPGSSSYCLNGAIYLISVQSFLETGELLPVEPVGLEMSSWESIDIDDPLDWILAETVASRLDPRGHLLIDGLLSAEAPCTVPTKAKQSKASSRVQDLVTPADPFIIAEIGVNHRGSREEGLKLVRMAASCGADAVKFQLFRADALARPDAPMAAYQEKQMEASGSQQSMLRSLETSIEDLHAYQNEAQSLGLKFGCTPFDPRSMDALVAMNPDFLKISSGDANNLPLLKQAASTQLPVVVSTGMCSMEEVLRIREVFQADAGQLAVLHCVSSYPAPLEECNLRALSALQEGRSTVGFSDHTLGSDASLAAVALGARILEKHITLRQDAVGPDHAASMDEKTFSDYVLRMRALAKGLGDGKKICMPCEEDVACVARKSIVLQRTQKSGYILEAEDLTCLRPADGVAPTEFYRFVGRKLTRDLTGGSLLTWDDVQEEIK